MKEKRTEKTISFLSDKITMRGNLHVTSGIRIDGNFTGKIESTATIYIGDKSQINSEIVAKYVVSSGDVNGDLNVEETVALKLPGTFTGNIQTCNLSIEKGVVFNGQCQILSPKNLERPEEIKIKHPKKAIVHR